MSAPVLLPAELWEHVRHEADSETRRRSAELRIV